MNEDVLLFLFCCAPYAIIGCCTALSELCRFITSEHMETLAKHCTAKGHADLTANLDWIVKSGLGPGMLELKALFSSPDIPRFVTIASKPQPRQLPAPGEPTQAGAQRARYAVSWTEELCELLSSDERAQIARLCAEHRLEVREGTVSFADRGFGATSRKARNIRARIDAAAHVAETLRALGPRARTWLESRSEHGDTGERLLAMEQLLTRYPESPEASRIREATQRSGSIAERALVAVITDPSRFLALAITDAAEEIPAVVWRHAMQLDLRSLDRGERGELLNRAIAAGDPEMVQRALALLDTSRLSPALDALARAAARPENQEVSWLLAQRLAKTRSPDAEPPLLALLDRREQLRRFEWWVTADVIAALAAVGTEHAIPPLRACHADRDEDDRVRGEALDAVTRIQARLDETIAGSLALASPDSAADGALSLAQGSGRLSLSEPCCPDFGGQRGGGNGGSTRPLSPFSHGPKYGAQVSPLVREHLDQVLR